MLGNIRATVAIFAVLAFLTGSLNSQQIAPDVTIRDDSDWWSIIRDSRWAGLEPQNRDLAATNFKVLGITVGNAELSAIQRKLGKATVVTRGDAGTSRSQICYTGNDNSKIHLSFETGEVEYAFYLFSDGPNWTGSNLCTRSKSITTNLSTASGLHLGQSPAQVEAILGKPTSKLQNGGLIYFRQIKKRTAPSDLGRLRRYHSDLSEQEFHENYDFYYFTASILAKFSDSKLVYLGVDQSETD